MKKYSECLKEAEKQLLDVGIEDALLDARLLLQDCFNLDTATFLANLQAPIRSKRQYQTFLRRVARRKLREPLHYIIGHVSFCAHSYQVGPGVLIPRPETEIIIEKLDLLYGHLKNEKVFIYDIGFGSGILAIEAAFRFPKANVIAWDSSKKAAKVARANAVRLGQSHIEFRVLSVFKDSDALLGMLRKPGHHIILTNPPYIPSKVVGTLAPEVAKYEPKQALDGGGTGLAFYKRLLEFCRFSTFHFLGEIGINQTEELSALLSKFGYRNWAYFDDLQEIPRVLSLTHLPTQ